MSPTTLHLDTFCNPTRKSATTFSLWNCTKPPNATKRLTAVRRLANRNLALFYDEKLNYYEMASPRIFEIHSIHQSILKISMDVAKLGDIYLDLHKKEDNTLENIQAILDLTNTILEDYERRFFASLSED